MERATRMPKRLAGLWSGASGMHDSIKASFESSMTVGVVIEAPPCTTRCPTTSISFTRQLDRMP